MNALTGTTQNRTREQFYPGLAIGRLTLVDSYLDGDKGRRFWHSLCSCGKRTVVRQDYLKTCILSGLGSCGCLQRDTAAEQGGNTVHGMCATPTWNTWVSMNRRCYDPKYKSYGDYGAKGVTVCEAWQESFVNFFADMGERPTGKTLDRVENSLGYFKSNCRWATSLEQMRNTTRSVFAIVGGERKTLSEWATLCSTPYDTLKRLDRENGELELRISSTLILRKTIRRYR